MSVITNYIGRFGNNLFQYVYARLFAEKHGLKLLTPFCHENIVRMKSQCGGSTILAPIIGIDDNHEYMLNDRTIDRAQYHFNGYFQKSEWYIPYIDKIKEFAKPVQTIDCINYDDIVIHIRRSDYPHQCQIHSNWYLNILRTEKFNKLYIVMEPASADPDPVGLNAYLNEFSHYSPIIISGSVADDWNFLRKFDRILISNSTYAWWAAFFSDASKIYVMEDWTFTKQYRLSDFPTFTKIKSKFRI